MRKTLTITLEETLYNQREKLTGSDNIGQPIESLVTFQLSELDLAKAYQELAADEAREAKAVEWSEAMIGDIADEEG